MTTKVQVQTPALFDFDQCLFFLDRGYDECLFQLEERKVHRAITYGDELLPFTVTDEENGLVIEMSNDLPDDQVKFVKDYVREWFDLDRDIEPFYDLLTSIESLNDLKNAYEGLRLIGIPDLFEAMCWSIIGQQINLTFAFKLKRKLVEIYGKSIQWNSQTLYHFPTPESLIKLDEDVLRANQFSRGKIQYLKNVASAFLENGLDKRSIAAIPDFESRQKKLIEIKGIGVWSANYALMKTLHQPEAIPFGDTGLTQALFNHKIIEDRKDEAAIKQFFKSVKGWEAYTVFYLWRSLAG
ncbi:DNA-3-methyladenine glycosylase [Roseivirga sp. E12]|uniref:DNA-3-methyladenine glycosylase family protein n=1 Tax=Roseivirga sp. E12 TaxID=2819237 RepID=UPI001ABC10ED|nr:DNA-3-methyladenine glycosylase 2 family protein [Roseivirga sp. E12]MBO3697805.1 DNA-3-methyladenine glycosylase 2 family protein [Roseivirga sp. E12]